MRLIRIFNEASFFEACGEAARAIRGGGVVVVPTDTVYGIVCDATNAAAVERIFSIKQRLPEKPVSLFVRDAAHAERYAEMDEAVRLFLSRAWPGAVTALLPLRKDAGLSPLVGRNNIVGLRAPDYRFLAALIAAAGVPLAQTSANISGEAPASVLTDGVMHALCSGGAGADIFIDGGACAGTPSTVVDCTRAPAVVVREGAVSPADIFRMFSVYYK